jgi:AcrR family transcriptional regulator
LRLVSTGNKYDAGVVRSRTRLDRAAVVIAARDLLDKHGVAAFSMVRLGERLGVTGMALYRHVSDRAELERAVVALVLDDLAIDTELDSGDAIATWMRRVRAHWLEHPWLGALLGSSSGLDPSWAAAHGHLAGALEGAGLSGDDVARELVRISRITCGIVFMEVAAPLPDRGALGAPLSPYSAALGRYSNDALFDDVVADTLIRVQRVAAKA